jgi:RimJ/RimL family protein N-acetyltransferase
MTELRGRRVLLRAFRADEFDEVLRRRQTLWTVGEHDELALRSVRERLEHSGTLHRGWLDLAIELDGRLVGEIDARHPPHALPPGVFEVGIGLFEDADRGRGAGTEAVELLTSHLFDTLLAERVQASTDVANSPMRAVLAKLGFREEGILRGFMPTPAGRADYVMFGVTRADWQGRGRRRP